MDWSPYLVGGATRPDAISGLDPRFAASVWDMLQAAEADGVDLRITSAFRSPEVQARLYESALAKYGDEATARKWVAPPGRSQHNRGLAVDFAGPGGLLRDANSPEAQWIAANAGRFGLDVPMDWEPWQVEMADARGGDMPSQPAPNAPGGAQEAPDNLFAAYNRMQAMRAMMPRYETPQINAFRIERV